MNNYEKAAKINPYAIYEYNKINGFLDDEEEYKSPFEQEEPKGENPMWVNPYLEYLENRDDEEEYYDDEEIDYGFENNNYETLNVNSINPYGQYAMNNQYDYNNGYNQNICGNQYYDNGYNQDMFNQQYQQIGYNGYNQGYNNQMNYNNGWDKVDYSNQPGYDGCNPIYNNQYYNNNNSSLYDNNPYNDLGGYYGNYFNTSDRRKALEEKRLQEENQFNLFKKLHVKNYISMGYSKEESEKLVEEAFNPKNNPQNQIDQDAMIANRISRNRDNLERYHRDLEYQRDKYIERHNKIYNDFKKEYPDDMGALEFFEKAGDLYIEALTYFDREKQKDLTKIYNSNDYKTLVKQSANPLGTYFENTFKRIKPDPNNLGSLEIKLPDSIKRDFDSRKKKFLDSIFNN